MNLALMQPYFFPYVGYFSLCAAVDRFVFYDDVQYIKNGWINRNRVLVAGSPRYITIPLRGAGISLRINEVEVQPAESWAPRLLECLRHNYRKAPHFQQVMEVVRSVLGGTSERLADIARSSVQTVASYLDLPVTFVESSTGYGNSQLRSAERVLDICLREQATDYYNLPGGRSLYEADMFQARGISLHFVEPVFFPYPQFGDGFEPGLSIIDVLMHNEPALVRQMLRAGTLGQQ